MALLIGGPLNGQQVDVPKEKPYYEVLQMEPKKYRYARLALIEGRDAECFVFTEMSVHDARQALLQALYDEGKKGEKHG